MCCTEKDIMSKLNFSSLAEVLLEDKLNEFPNLEASEVGYSLQDSIYLRSISDPKFFNYDQEIFSAKQKEFFCSLADALLDLCKEKYGEYIS